MAELDDIVQRLFDALTVVEQAAGYVAPYVPTPSHLVDVVAEWLAYLAARVAGKRQPVVLEAGCGDGRVAAAVARRGAYTVCLELDENLAAKAHPTVSSTLGDTVQADLRTLPLRGADTVYAYLLPDGVKALLDQKAAPLTVSMDYTAPGRKPNAVVAVDHHYLYIYVLGVNLDLKTVLEDNTPERINITYNP